MAAVGSTYYMLDARSEVLHANWLILSGLWYFSIAFSLFFTFNEARLGAITAGIIGFAYSAPNQYIYNIAGHFKVLYAVIIGSSLVFHLIYGALALSL